MDINSADNTNDAAHHQAAAQTICADIYIKTAAYYAHLAPHLGDQALGYKILYSPPIIDAPFLFMGFQPGGSLSDAQVGKRDGERTGWPTMNEYAKASWKLAVKARRIWGERLLRTSVGLNRVFFRAPGRDEWSLLPSYWRNHAEDFSGIHCKAIIAALRPRRIVIFGLHSVPEFIPGRDTLRSGKRRLVQDGCLWGIPASAVIHPTGARLSATDEELISGHFRTV